MDGNKEEEGCLLPGTNPKPSHPTPPPGSQLTRFPCLLKRQKGGVESAACNNRRLKALNNMKGFAEEETKIYTSWSFQKHQHKEQVVKDLTPK